MIFEGEKIPDLNISAAKLPRLIIKNVKLTNFKSYYGVHNIGPFHQNFSSIIGPNGSGKSNLIDSLVFVFGKRASWLRLKNLKELIHNSALYGACKHAEVLVEFVEIIDSENEKKFNEVPGSSFTVSRIVSSNNDNSYTINDNKVNLKEVTNLLKNKGIDLDNNRFIILQGEVEQISLMKPKTNNYDSPGFLEYLEEIIGTNLLIPQIEELQERLEGQMFTQMESGDRFKILEDEVKKLSEAKDQAVDYLKHEKIVYQLNNLKHQIKEEEIRENLSNTKNDLQKIVKEEKQLDEDFLVIVERNRAKLDRYNRLKKEKVDHEVAIDKLQTNIKFKEEEFAKIEQDKVALVREQNRMEERAKNLAIKRDNFIGDKKRMIESYPKIEEQLKSLAQDKIKQEAKTDLITKRYQEQFDKNTLILNDLRMARTKMDKRKKELEKKLQSDQEVIRSGQTKFERFEKEFKSLDDELSTANEDKIKIQNRIDSVDVSIAKTTAEITKHQLKIDGLVSEINTVNREHKLIQQQLLHRNEGKEMNEKRNGVLDQLIAAQREGKLSGIRGRIGDLVSIPKELDSAISSAGGNGWNKIVVNTFAEGKKIIDFLKYNKIGLANLILLDVINKNDNLRNDFNNFVQPLDGDVKRLYDFVKIPDKNIDLAVFSILQNTLVCRSIALANKVAFGSQRQRVVTYEGHLLEKTGVISGGGEPRKGFVKIDSYKGPEIGSDVISNNELSKNERNLVRKSEDLAFALNETKNSLYSLKSDERKLLDEKNRKQIELRNINDKIHALELIFPERKADFEKQKIQLLRIDEETRIQNMTKAEIEECDKQLTSLMDQIAEVENQQAKLGGEQLRNAREVLQEIINSIRENEEKINHKEAFLVDIENKINRSENDFKECEKRKVDISDELVKKNEELDRIQDETMRIIDEVEKSKSFIDEKEAIMNESKNELSELEKTMGEKKIQKREIRNIREEKEAFIRKTDGELENIRQKVQSIRNNYRSIISDYDFLDDIDENSQTNQEIEKTAQRNSKNDEKELTSFQPKTSKRKLKSHSSNLIEWDIVFSIDVFGEYETEFLKKMRHFLQEVDQRFSLEEEEKKNKMPNLNSITEFRQRNKVYKEKKKDLEALKRGTDLTRNLLEQKRAERKEKFLEAFTLISSRLKHTYQGLTNGGDAELEIIDCFDPFSEGILFSVRPPNKSWKQMSKLSGGEKTLSSLSFIFALHYFKPNPIYLMDEIDAALDYKNVAIVAQFVKEQTKNAQFIVISLRSSMFELADKLFGVYKTFDVTKTIGINPVLLEKLCDEYASKAQKERQISKNSQIKAN